MKKPFDIRLSWRDPNMPVLRDYTMAGGIRKTVVDPDYERRYREMLMKASLQPDYHNDPTYNLRRKK